MISKVIARMLLSKSALAFFALTLLPCLSAQTAPAPSVEEQPAQAHITAGDKLREKRDWQGALPEYREAVRLAPDSPEAHAGLAWALSWKGDVDNAMREDRESLRLKPDFAEGHNGLGWCLSQKGDMDGAMREYREAIRLNPDYEKPHYNLAWTLRQKGDVKGALGEYLEATRVKPDDPDNHYMVGWAFEHTGDRQSALAHYRKAFELSPKNSAFEASYGRLQSEVALLPASWSPSMVFAFTIASALVPSFLLFGYFRARDLYPEPARMLWATFILGVLIVFPVLLIDWPLDQIVKLFHGAIPHGLAQALFTAAIPEELLKFAVVVLFCARSKEFDEPMDGIVYGVVASLGFATYENIMYVSQYGLWVAISRAILSVPGHAFMGAVMGYFVGQWRFGAPGRRSLSLLMAYVVPVGLHWLYDFPLMANRFVVLSNLVLLLEAIWALRLASRLRKEQIQLTREIAASAAAAQGAMDIVALIRAPETPPSAGPGWVMAVLGGLIATAGGFLSLCIVLVLAERAHLAASDLFAGATIGGIPLLVGMVLFVFGVKRIHASRRLAPVSAPLGTMAASVSA